MQPCGHITHVLRDLGLPWPCDFSRGSLPSRRLAGLCPDWRMFIVFRSGLIENRSVGVGAVDSNIHTWRWPAPQTQSRQPIRLTVRFAANLFHKLHRSIIKA